MADISQVIFLNSYIFLNKNYCPFIQISFKTFPSQRIQLTTSQRWFRQWVGADQAKSHYRKQGWFSLLTHIHGAELRWVKCFQRPAIYTCVSKFDENACIWVDVTIYNSAFLVIEEYTWCTQGYHSIQIMLWSSTHQNPVHWFIRYAHFCLLDINGMINRQRVFQQFWEYQRMQKIPSLA